jgi:hypothetical protein
LKHARVRLETRYVSTGNYCRSHNFHAFWKAWWKLIDVLELLCNNTYPLGPATEQNFDAKPLGDASIKVQRGHRYFYTVAGHYDYCHRRDCRLHWVDCIVRKRFDYPPLSYPHKPAAEQASQIKTDQNNEIGTDWNAADELIQTIASCSCIPLSGEESLTISAVQHQKESEIGDHNPN